MNVVSLELPWARRLRRAVMETVVQIFALVVSVCTGVVFGLAPALAVSRSSSGSQATGLRRGSYPGHTRLRSLLVVSQTAMAVVLLIGATLLIRSLVAMRTVDTGFGSATS